MADVASRLGADVKELTFAWRTPVDAERVVDELNKADYKLVIVVFAGTSTGVRNPVERIGRLLKGKNTFFLVDAVAVLGGMPVEVDKWCVDICYSGSQKCLSCPPGALPITFYVRSAGNISKTARRQCQTGIWICPC